MKLGVEYVCLTVSRLECALNLMVLLESIVAIVCVSLVLCRMQWRNFKRLPGPDTSIGRLIEYLVKILCIFDLLYHIPDIFFALDNRAPPLYLAIGRLDVTHPTRVHTILYIFLREGMGMLSVFWHGTIAYCMYSWVVLKRSATRLKRRRLYVQFVTATFITGLRFVLWLELGIPGLMTAVLLYDAVVVPVCIFCMAYWYTQTARTLYRGGVASGSGTRSDTASRDGPSVSSNQPSGQLTSAPSPWQAVRTMFLTRFYHSSDSRSRSRSHSRSNSGRGRSGSGRGLSGRGLSSGLASAAGVAPFLFGAASGVGGVASGVSPILPQHQQQELPRRRRQISLDDDDDDDDEDGNAPTEATTVELLLSVMPPRDLPLPPIPPQAIAAAGMKNLEGGDSDYGGAAGGGHDSGDKQTSSSSDRTDSAAVNITALRAVRGVQFSEDRGIGAGRFGGAGDGVGVGVGRESGGERGNGGIIVAGGPVDAHTPLPQPPPVAIVKGDSVDQQMTVGPALRPAPVHVSDSGRSSRAGSGGNRSSDMSRHMPIVKRLVVISCIVSAVWIAGSAMNLGIWINYFLVTHVHASKILHVMRLVIVRMIGIVDAVVLGGLCSFSWGGTSTASHSVASMSYVAPAREQSWFGRSASYFQRRRASPDGNESHAEAPGVELARRLESGRRFPSGARLDSGFRESSLGPSLTPFLGRRMSSEMAPPSLISRWSGSQKYELSYRQRLTKPGSIRIFATTWNLGGVAALEVDADLPSMLPKWIPQNYDLYVIGVQECVPIKEFKAVVHAYLGGADKYIGFARELGDARVLHGVIAVLLFARTQDVEDGVFEIHRGAVSRVASGVNLGPMGRAPNKGMVGMCVRYFDCSLALVTAHFAADLRGKSRVHRRNQDAYTTLKELSLMWDSDEFDVHTQHHHALLVGDLNYRCMSSPDEILSLVAASAQATADAMSPSPSTISRNSSSTTPTARIMTAGPSPLAAVLEAAIEEKGSFIGPPFAAPDVAGPVSWREKSLAKLLSPVPSPLPLPSATNSVDPSIVASFRVTPPRLSTGRLGVSPPRAQFFRGRKLSPPKLGLKNSSPGISPRGGGARGGNGQGARHGPSALGGMRMMRRATGQVVVPKMADAELSFWSWVPELDELSRAMRDETVFWGFDEGQITFPPSYRWRRGGDGGDFTDAGHMTSHAYTVSVSDGVGNEDLAAQEAASESGSEKLPEPEERRQMIKSFLPRQETMRLRPSDSVVADDAASSLQSPMRMIKPSVSTTTISSNASNNNNNNCSQQRTPSYTDRVLTHSLPGRAARLKWVHYDMVDAVTLSDHRPVAATLEIQVDRAVRGFTDDTWSAPGEKSNPSSILSTLSFKSSQTGPEDDVGTFSIHLDRPRLESRDTSQPLDVQPREVTVLFPLISEDPLAFQRQAESLSSVFPGSSIRSVSLLQPGSSEPATEMQQPQVRYRGSIRHFAWSAFPVRHKATASFRFSEHMLLKVSDGRGTEIGQGVVVLKDFVGSEAKRAKVELSSGGALKGFLLIDVRVKCSAAASSVSRTQSQSSGGGRTQQSQVR